MPRVNSFVNDANSLLRSKLSHPYFKPKSFMPAEVSFHLLQLRLIAHVQGRLQRGDITERGLARLTGISQPHLHNILKGVRVLSPHMADLILRQLHINLIDLLESDELSRRHLPGAPK